MYNFPPPYSSFYKNNKTSHSPKKTTPNSNKQDIHKKEEKNSTNEENCINILGIKLYFDDLIILFLLFILYKEKVKDNELMICLLLLLFS